MSVRHGAIDQPARPKPADAAAAWVRAMRRGEFGAAWRVSDAVLEARRRASGRRWDVPRHEQWIWDGRPLAGQRVLVRCYHGLGDTLQFARFLPRVAQVCRELTVWVQPALLPLLEHVPASLTLLPLHDGEPGLDYDVDVEIMELGHALRISLETLNPRVPYLRVPAEPRRGSAFSVGLVAQTGDWDPRRSIPPELMARLTRAAPVRTYSLHLGSRVPGAEDLSTPDVLGLARRMLGLDLIVTVDTMTAHLAGALGVPTWTLLQADADWRWMTGRDDSPWYPSMRLFRQPSAGDWASVIGQVSSALAAAAS